MAYAMLANVPPEMGIYCSIFPVLLYGLVGPSGHISIGSKNLTLTELKI